MDLHPSPEATFERVRGVIADTLHVEPERITPDSRFRQDLGADSLELVELIIAMEREFDADVVCHIDGSWSIVLDEYSKRIQTVGQVVEWLELLAPLCCSHPLTQDRQLRERELEFRVELRQSPRPEERLLALLMMGTLDRGDFGWLA